MHASEWKSNIRNLVLPLSMIGGAVFYKWIGELTFISPYLIFIMLFITYCKLSIKDFKPDKFEVILLGVQMVIAAAVYIFFFFINSVIAEGLFICCYIPTATAAPVITSMLGGRISRVATYTLMCNLFVAITGPFLLAAIGDHPEITFFESFKLILGEVFPLIIFPLLLAFLLRATLPKLHERIMKLQILSFFLWAIALFIVVGSSVSFAINNWSPQDTYTILFLTIGALAVCVLQFATGRYIGGKFNDKISGGQSLGQKNTVLAIWLALTYLNPLASLAPAAYVAWQNIINSWQLMKHNSKMEVKTVNTVKAAKS